MRKESICARVGCMRRTLFVVVGAVVSALVLPACGASTSTEPATPVGQQTTDTTTTESTTTATSTTTDTTTTESTPEDTTPSETTPAKSTGPAVLGDNRAEWDSTHQPDDRGEPGTGYDPSPDLGDGVRFNDRFYTVLYDGDRVMSFSMRFPAHTGIGTARAEAMQDALPSDAKVVAFVRNGGNCAQLFVSSRSLDTKFGRPLRGLAEFVSGEMGDYYDPANVSEAIVQTLTPTENPSNAAC
jgi:hypothetical protein